MALSNIFREPRREITEQFFGVAAVAGWIFGAYGLAKWMGATKPEDVVFLTFLMAVAILLLIPVAFFLHALGEGVCAVLANMGLDPRPRRRA